MGCPSGSWARAWTTSTTCSRPSSGHTSAMDARAWAWAIQAFLCLPALSVAVFGRGTRGQLPPGCGSPPLLAASVPGGSGGLGATAPRPGLLGAGPPRHPGTHTANKPPSPHGRSARPLPKPAPTLGLGLVPAAVVTGMTAPWPVSAPAGQPLLGSNFGGTQIEELKDSCPLGGGPCPCPGLQVSWVSKALVEPGTGPVLQVRGSPLAVTSHLTLGIGLWRVSKSPVNPQVTACARLEDMGHSAVTVRVDQGRTTEQARMGLWAGVRCPAA